jgi:hypothetical protein
MIRCELHRFMSDQSQTLGTLTLYDYTIVEGNFSTLELPWADNQKMISCIPEGEYSVTKRNSDKYGDHWHIQDVPDRSLILIHHGNYHKDTKGCILLGMDHGDINLDGLIDVTRSKFAMNKFNSLLGEQNEFQLKIFS